MRNIINISLPKEMVRAVEHEVKSGKFASKSEFFRNLLCKWEEDRISEAVLESRAECAAGKGKLLRSFADLD